MIIYVYAGASGLSVFFYGHKIPPERGFMVALFPEVAALSDEGISETVSFCIY